MKMPTCLVKLSAIMHWCCGQGWGHRETSSIWDAWKAQQDDGLSKETTASSEFDHWTRPTNMQSLRISLQAQRH